MGKKGAKIGNVIRIPIQCSTPYEVRVGSGVLHDIGQMVRECKPGVRRVLVVSNRRVHSLYGDPVERSLKSAGIPHSVHLAGDGERYKNMRSLERLLTDLNSTRVTRSDAIVALGGGVVGDLAGFAAAVHYRGIAFFQVPTTLLAMIDSSVGGKTGINMPYGKNVVGAFHQPSGVLADVTVLGSLLGREMTAGLCEAVKHGAIAGDPLFGATADFLRDFGPSGNSRTIAEAGADRLADLIADHIRFKASIVSGDEHESLENTSALSRKVLNFGHTFAHALEKVTDYRYFKHGEAVGYGILFAAGLSKRLELLSPDSVELLNGVVRSTGHLPPLAGLEREMVLAAFSGDKKIVGGTLQWILLRDIGEPLIMSGSKIPAKAINSTLNSLIPE